MVEHALSKKLGLDREKIECQFERVVIDDSTVFQLPEEYSGTYRGSGGGASKAGIKNQYCYDLLSQEIIDITVQEGTVPDCKYPLQDIRQDRKAPVNKRSRSIFFKPFKIGCKHLYTGKRNI
jgi:hypothetical protein